MTVLAAIADWSVLAFALLLLAAQMLERMRLVTGSGIAAKREAGRFRRRV